MAPTRRQYLGRVGHAGGVCAGTLLGGCASDQQHDSESVSVRIGSKPFAEQKILGYLTYQRLQSVDRVRAVDEIGSGNSLSNWEATAAGQQHLYWEYTGTAWMQLPPRHETRITDPDSLYERVQSDAHSQQLQLAEPAPFSNEYVIVADAVWAERTGVSTIEDGIHRCVHCGTDGDDETYTYCENCGSINCPTHVETERLADEPVCTGCAVTERFALKTKYFYDEENRDAFAEEYEAMPVHEKARENPALAVGGLAAVLLVLVGLVLSTGVV